MTYLFTSESVSEGHPDKVADAISDAVLDLTMVTGDRAIRCACETLVTTNRVVLAGEYKGILHKEEVESTVRKVIKDIGYKQDGFHWETVEITNLMHGQSPDIALGTDNFGAGDQGIMFGYACNENEAYMPSPIYYAHSILKQLKNVRGNSVLGPDAKSQVSVEYVGGIPKRVDKIVVSSQHEEGKIDEARTLLKDLSSDVLGNLIDENTVWYLNPTGNFVIGGPDGDVGLTGRKIIVDTYGGYAPHGGGAFSGKDPTKVDRSAAYVARWLAKNVVANGMADWCQIQLSYAIGIKDQIGRAHV